VRFAAAPALPTNSLSPPTPGTPFTAMVYSFPSFRDEVGPWLPPDWLPIFTEVHVSLDLHLGGREPAFQMFPASHAELLERFIDQHLISSPCPGPSH
jgi:hypothetical protein